MIQVINLQDKFSKFDDYWHPRIIGELNDSHVKAVKLHGEFVWHHHDSEDELFLVVEGALTMRLRDGDVQINPGEFLIVPRGVEHCPVATQPVKLILLEPKSTSNTGNVQNERTVESEWI
jgi:mannose-6-phosphate isomerase-like protein (cupin superfamily)